jgi:serine/threonine protein kinase
MTELGKYEILEEIGRGGFAAVYKARDTELDRVIALKVLHPQLTVDPKFIQRFRQEVRTASGLRHPNIVAVYEAGEAKGQLYIAMKLVVGHSLTDLIQTHGALPISGILSITKEIAAALDYIHEQRLVHRDVKPSNILIDRRGRVMLSDFGLVRATEEPRLTSQGVSVGTPSYMAPEQAEGKQVDARTDTYALGVVLYEMVTGRLPFLTDSPAATFYQHVHEAPPPPSSVDPNVTPAVEQVILRALEKNPDGRYQTAGALADDLIRAVAGRPLASRPQLKPESAVVPSPRPQRAPKPTQPELKRRGPTLGTAIGCITIFLCVVLAGGGFLAWQGGLLDAFLPAPATSAEAPGPTAILPTSTTLLAQVSPPPTLTPEPVSIASPEPIPTQTPEPTTAPVPPTLESTATPKSIPTPTPAPPMPEPAEGMIVRTLSNEQGDVEPNNTFLNARRIHFGDQVEGIIEHVGDWDNFYFYGEQDVAITIDVDAETEGSNLDSYVSIWNTEGQRLTYNYYDGYTNDARIENWPLPVDGVYIIQIKERGDDIGGANYFYKLSLQPSGVPEPTEIPPVYLIPEQETNDVIPNAMLIQFGDRVFGVIGQAGDRDYFSFDGYGGTEVAVDINAVVDGSSLDSYVAIWNVEGKRLGYNYHDGYTNDARLIFTLPGDGRYFLQISNRRDDVGGQRYFYALWLTAPDGIAGPTPTTVAYGQETEPNDTFSTATVISIGSTIRGTIDRMGDVDYFHLEGLAGEYVLLDVNAVIDGSPLDSYLSVWDSEEHRLEYNYYDGYTNDARIQRFRFPTDSVYYIEVRERGDDGGGAEYFYTLRVLPAE